MTTGKIEWPTWIALFVMHLGWALVLYSYQFAGLLVLIPGAVLVAFHSSLQHEALHGHPTRNRWVNELLVCLPVGLFIPYRRFHDLHLRHHNDSRLTDPYDDPESRYLAERDWNTLSMPMRWLFAVNATFAGRLLLGPILMVVFFLIDEARLIAGGDKRVRQAWIYHVAGLVPVLWFISLSGMPLWLYVVGIALPALSLLAVRIYIEHRAADCPMQRSAIVEANWFWSLLFLNNNLHRVHHEKPALAWYQIPAEWNANRDRFLKDNGHYYIRGYGEVMRNWFLRRREPVIHPTMRRDT
ncbi:fatty acid desaturase [Rhodobacteraceae bacterium NNCM2]|nr:fatty acid desaturase [Coraliihabitans acroporae]